jgi:hypothetical protein
MCIPADSMLWALVARIRDDGYAATAEDMRALVGSGCPAPRVREVLQGEMQRAGARGAAFARAIEVLERAATRSST